MPLDHVSFKYRCLGWELKRSLWPRKCHYTGKTLWLRKAYRGTAMITGPGDPIFVDRWCHASQYLFLKLKGII